MTMGHSGTESQIVYSSRFLMIQALFVIVVGIVVTIWTRNYVSVLRDVSSTLWLAGRRQLAFLSAGNKLVWTAASNDIDFQSHFVP